MKASVKYITKGLDKMGYKYILRDNNIILTDELEDNFITEWNYPCSLNEELSNFNNVIDRKFSVIFECEWSGTFICNCN